MFPPPLSRALSALGGSLLGAGLVGLSSALGAPRGQRFDLFTRLTGLLSVPALCVGCAFALPFALASGERLQGLSRWARAHHRGVSLSLAVIPPTLVLWVGLTATLGRFFMTAFHHVGLASMAQSTVFGALVLLLGAASLGISLVLSRRLPAESPSVHRTLSFPIAIGLFLSALLIAHGVFYGDADGHGGLLGSFGVLKKPELDLSPVAQLLGILASGLGLGTVLRPVAPAALLLGVILSVWTYRIDRDHFSESPVSTTIDARPGVARAVLRLLRKRSDVDRDGYSSRFGGGDCDDRRASRNPGASEVPGNGIDEDCTGRDAPRPESVALASVPATVMDRLHTHTSLGMNLAVITVDTLRWDTHYAGYSHPITPNLDRLAARSVVFDHAYALSSYTGRAIGPLMTGRYPTECPRDSEHFTRYLPGNVFLAERLREHGFRTFGAASHFYFERRFGLAQGVDTWDMSGALSELETVSADPRVTDRALSLLGQHGGASGRFFMWVHYFDPHKQYVNHPDLPLFASGERGRYDREVMSTDREVGRLLSAIDARDRLPGARPTVVLVTADHGEAFMEHGMPWHGVELWEELVRVPWLIYVPGLPVRHVTTPRSQIDMVPTLLDLLRLPSPPPEAPDRFSGVSLVADLLGSEAPARPMYIDLPEGPFNSLRRSVIEGGWKLTERGVGRFELYHLSDDPGETHNLAQSAAAELQRMRGVMESVRARLSVAPALPRN